MLNLCLSTVVITYFDCNFLIEYAIFAIVYSFWSEIGIVHFWVSTLFKIQNLLYVYFNIEISVIHIAGEAQLDRVILIYMQCTSRQNYKFLSWFLFYTATIEFNLIRFRFYGLISSFIFVIYCHFHGRIIKIKTCLLFACLVLLICYWN